MLKNIEDRLIGKEFILYDFPLEIELKLKKFMNIFLSQNQNQKKALNQFEIKFLVQVIPLLASYFLGFQE